MRNLWILAVFAALPIPLAGQAWDDVTVLALVERARARRAADAASGLEDFRAQAHGFVFFLAQLGDEGLEEPPQLVKSDELMLEVYWRAPGRSKQRILGWRDRADLPTDIAYHRDHLGIVQNGFADRIRLGEGDEVRDVPHPLAPDAAPLYHYAIVDSTLIRMPDREIRVVEVAFRPVDLNASRIAGSMYLDRSGGELVRLRFNFTRAAYRDPSVEDITIVLENGLWDGRWWLPRRQEIEIRRGTTWLDMPARGIIRGRWEITGYAFNTGLSDTLFGGLEIDQAPQAVRDSFPWRQPMGEAIAQWAGSASVLELREARERVRAVVGGRDLTGMPLARPAVRGVSEVLHVNRVEGLALGFGYRVRPGAGAVTVRAWAGFGLSDQRPKGRVSVSRRGGATELTVSVRREVADVLGGAPVAPAINSLFAQEAGRDYGDWVMVSAGDVSVETGVWAGGRVRVSGGWRHTASLAVQATPTWGSYRTNAPFGVGGGPVGTVALTHARGAPTGRFGTRIAAATEVGHTVTGAYVRGRLDLALARPVRGGDVLFDGWVGWGSVALPPDRSFAIGGRTTLPGEPHRAYGGRAAAWGRVGWRVPVPFPAVPLGPYASTGDRVALTPFVALGWAGLPVSPAPWGPSNGLRPVVGLGADLLHRLLRVETGIATRTGKVGLTVDVRQSLWPIL